MSREEAVGLGMEGRRGGAASFQWSPGPVPPTSSHPAGVPAAKAEDEYPDPKGQQLPLPLLGARMCVSNAVLVPGAVPWWPLCSCSPGCPQPGHPSLGYRRVSISEAWLRGPPPAPLLPAVTLIRHKRSSPRVWLRGVAQPRWEGGSQRELHRGLRLGLSSWVRLSLGRSL